MQCWLVGDHLLLLRDFGPHVIIFMNVCVITVTLVWLSFAVKGFRALLDNIISVAIVMLLREAYYVHALQLSTVIIRSYLRLHCIKSCIFFNKAKISNYIHFFVIRY
jgi:hypothetical protein